MSIGMILLVVVGVLALFGVLQRVLDRMRLKDWQALVVVAATFVGGWIPDIRVTDSFSFNIGGALIPFALCVYLFIRAGTAKERIRAVVASLGAGVLVYAMGRLLPDEPEAMWIDPNYLYGIAAGILAYVMGRSRRSAFIAGVMGILLADTAQAIINYATGLPVSLKLGDGGMYDAVVISGILAVAFAEIFGEIRERLHKKRIADGKEEDEDPVIGHTDEGHEEDRI